MRVSHLSLAFIGLAIVPAAAAQNHPGTVKAVLQTGPDVGQRAPDFSLPWANREGVGPIESPYQLASDRGKTVVVAFYPRDFTKGCTAELQTFAEQYASLNLPFRLLSDPEQRVSKQYASKDSGGYNRRTVYVIGPDGRVKYRNMKF